ncbi:MAG: TIGR01212 family radical SAM protein [Bacteroidales bacterium]|nr:TIGR01212 family radical SAM protein [Bacteroidales bacterium]
MDNSRFPKGKRYNTYVEYCRRRYGQRLQKLVLDAGFTCPNRDGTVGRGGCTYCDNAAFHPGYSTAGKSLVRQLDEGIEFHKVRYRSAAFYLAYFQSYSNTYAPLERLRDLYLEALSHPSVAGIVIGTRPDCVDGEKLDFLRDLMEGKVLRNWKRELSGGTLTAPVVNVEYGIESCSDTTLERINRGHDFNCSVKAVEETAARGLPVGAHFILGLPGETRDDMLALCEKINALPLTSVKFHQLQIIKGTKMEAKFKERPGDFYLPDLDGYLDLIIDILERLRPDLCIERVAGEVPPRFVETPKWGLIRNFDIIHRLDAKMEERDAWQGSMYKNS